MKYIHNNTELVIQNDKYIGEGTQWRVNKLLLAQNYHYKNITYTSLVYKKSLGNKEHAIKKNLSNYQIVSDSGLKTLSFFERGLALNEPVIFAENMNIDSRLLFVSPNSAKNTTSKMQILQILSNRKGLNDINSIKKIPDAEKQLVEIGLNYISNFDSLFQLIKKEMDLATGNNINMCEDAFFFGINLSNSSIETYRIADFDNIGKRVFTKKERYSNEIIMLSSLWEFNLVFISNNDKRKEYDKILRQRIIELTEIY